MFKKVYDQKVYEILEEKDIEKQYNMIIDYLSNYLINNIKIYEMCDFKDNKCIANRLNKSVAKINGCCYIFRKGLCPNLDLKNKKCTIDCISCKLLICSYLEKKYGKIKLEKIFPLKKVFNRRQIEIVKRSFFKDKKEIITLLLNKK